MLSMFDLHSGMKDSIGSIVKKLDTGIVTKFVEVVVSSVSALVRVFRLPLEP